MNSLLITPSSTINKKLSIYILVISFFLSQFYLWSSGLPQLSHITAIMAFVSFIVFNRYLSIPNIQFLNLFIIYVIINNLAWFFISHFDQSYIFSIAYWAFNYLTFLLILNLKDSPVFIKLILLSISLSYITQLAIWFLGLGNYKFFPRYNGFFNDPNQMAFWALCTCSIYLFLSKNKTKDLIIYSIAVFLILITLSRSALLGVPFLTIALIIKSEGSFQKKLFITIASMIIVSIALTIIYNQGLLDNTIERFIRGLNEKDSQEDARGFNVISDYPEHFILGAGQGRYKLYALGEIHSTWLGLLFYYGVVGSSFFFLFLYQNFRKLSISEKLLFLSPMLYGFTTYSARNTIFWFLVSIFMIIKKTD